MTERYRRADDVREKTLGETFFLFTPRGGFYGFDGIGRDIWDLIVSGRTEEEVVDDILASYDADPASVRADVAEFVHDVRAQGLVEVCSEIRT